MEEGKYVDVRLVVNFHEEKMLELLNDGYEVLGMTSTLHGALTHHILMAKRETLVTKTKKPSKVNANL